MRKVVPECPAGQVLNVTDPLRYQCYPCPRGYQGKRGATTCVACQPGFYQKDPGKETCTSCDDLGKLQALIRRP